MEQKLYINDSGNYKAKNLESHITDISINGAGDVLINTTKKLNIDIYGNGNIFFRDNL